MRVALEPAADAYLEMLHHADPRAAGRVEEALDDLEADPSAARYRRHSIVPAGDERTVWGFVVAGQMILWRPQGEILHVLHIGQNVLF